VPLDQLKHPRAQEQAMPESNAFPGLPEEVVQTIRGAIFSEFATVSAQGVPIDTPTFAFADLEQGSIDIATGLAYPVKAERARRYPRVGMLLEGQPHEPVVSIAAHAAVRDADIQANVDRYIAETAAYLESFSNGNPWPVARNSTWYWTRIFVCCKPRRILWWPNAAAMDKAPQRWEAPSHTRFPSSDPAPAGKTSASPAWPARDWRERAAEVLGHGMHGHLTVLDDGGYPLPVRALSARQTDEGFALEVPAGIPWKIQGKATLCFLGAATFIGNAEVAGSGVRLRVERILPTLPLVSDPAEIWAPSASTRAALMSRLEQELARRGLGMPRIPEQLPAPTAGGLARAAQISRIAAETAMKRADPT
jgi:hypothetical protein